MKCCKRSSHISNLFMLKTTKTRFSLFSESILFLHWDPFVCLKSECTVKSRKVLSLWLHQIFSFCLQESVQVRHAMTAAVRHQQGELDSSRKKTREEINGLQVHMTSAALWRRLRAAAIALLELLLSRYISSSSSFSFVLFLTWMKPQFSMPRLYGE